MATVDIIELIKPETGEKFYPYAHLNGVKGAELLPRIGGSVQTTLPTPIFQVKDALNAQFYPQTHAQAVIGLAQMIEDNQFFEKESDGNGGFRIKLKDGFTGFYADGSVASGGVGSSGGGGGYGVESITSNQDGTVDFHFTGGDITTVDLNHEHPQYPKYVHLASESEMPANPDPNTMYIIDGSGGGGGGSYTLPIASASTLGGIKVGDGLSIDGNTGVLSTATKIVYLTSESQMPPSPDANTLYVILES